MMTFISLYANIGGIDLGLERAGMQCVAQVEWDDYAIRVLERHWPHVLRIRDVRDAGAHNLPYADIIAGGFVCKDVSGAGKRAGLEGDTDSGYTWREFARIVRELRPRYVLVENVAALLDRGMGRVLGDLSALRYDAEWSVVPACSLGAPHTRERVFIMAYTDIFNGQAGMGHVENRTPTYAPRNRPARSSHWLVPFDGPLGMVDGLPFGLERRQRLGLAVVPQVAEFIGRRILEHSA